MSGFLGNLIGGVQRVTSGVQALESLLGGPAPVTLGSITFNELEVPEKAVFGGKQMLAVHKLPGGARVIDAMGRDDKDIRWSGILEGPSATVRALEIDQLRIAGQQLQLSWDMLTWTVIISEFNAHYVHRNWIPYELCCMVVQDNSNGAFGGLSSFLPTNIQNDLNSVLGSVLPIAAPVSAAIGVAQAGLTVVGAFTHGSAAFATALQDMTSAQAAIADVTLAGNNGLAGVAAGAGGIAGILGSTRAVTAILNLQNFGISAGNLAGSVQQSGYVNRATTNLQNSGA